MKTSKIWIDKNKLKMKGNIKLSLVFLVLRLHMLLENPSLIVYKDEKYLRCTAWGAEILCYETETIFVWIKYLVLRFLICIGRQLHFILHQIIDSILFICTYNFVIILVVIVYSLHFTLLMECRSNFLHRLEIYLIKRAHN